MPTHTNGRLLGMTVPQIIILACLACVACGSVGTSFSLVSGMLSGQGEWTFEPVVPTGTPAPTGTPLPTPTLTVVPSPTAIPYESLIPVSWVQSTDASLGYEIWFPPEFVPEEPRAKLEQVIQTYREAGDESSASAMEAELEQSLEAYAVWVFDRVPSPLLFQSNISLTHQPLESGSLPGHVEAEIADLPGTMILMERKSMTINAYEAERLWIESKFGSTPVGQAVYFIRVQETVWMVTCSTHFNEFYTRLPAFDQVAGSFRIVPP